LDALKMEEVCLKLLLSTKLLDGNANIYLKGLSLKVRTRTPGENALTNYRNHRLELWKNINIPGRKSMHILGELYIHLPEQEIMKFSPDSFVVNFDPRNFLHSQMLVLT
jgi:hypothetical protein